MGGAGGAVISERLPDGSERPSAHMSRRLTALRITQTEKEPVSYSGWRVCSALNATREVMHLDN